VRACAWGLAATGVLGAAVTSLLAVLNGGASPGLAGVPLGAVSFCVTAALLVNRLPDNVVRWLLAVAGSPSSAPMAS